MPANLGFQVLEKPNAKCIEGGKYGSVGPIPLVYFKNKTTIIKVILTEIKSAFKKSKVNADKNIESNVTQKVNACDRK